MRRRSRFGMRPASWAWWRRAVGVGAAAGLGVMWAQPAQADNCGSLADCLPSAQDMLLLLALAIAAILAAVLIAEFVGAFAAAEAAEAAAAAAEAAEAGAFAEEVTAVDAVVDLTADAVFEGYEGGLTYGEAVGDVATMMEGGASMGEMLPYVNAFAQGTENCASVAEAIDAILGGEAEVANLIGATQPAAIEGAYGGSFAGTTFEGISGAVEAAGEGARGFVAVAENGVGHVFNVVNEGGAAVFYDGQAVAFGTNGAEVAAASGYTNPSVWFLWTWP